MKTKFERELADLINKHSLENESNTPDFILATFLKGSLDNFNTAIDSREQWYGRGAEVVDDSIELPVDFMGNNTPNEIDLNPPPKQVFKIEVGDMNEADIDEYLKEITKQFKDNHQLIDFKGWNVIEPTDITKDEECEHDYGDGTGTGYYVCKKCGDQF